MPLTPASHLTRPRLVRTLAVLAALLAGSLAAAAALGPVALDLRAVVADPTSPDHTIFVYARLPRILLAAIVGAALGGAGAVLQGLLGNPLADPNLLGVSAGAAVAGAIAIVAGADPTSLLVPACAFAGALATITFVYAVARTHGRASPHAILLVGVVCNALAAAVIMLVNAVASYTQAQGVLFWIMGSLSTQSYGLVGGAALYVAVGAAVLLLHAPAVNLLATGEDGARALGVDVDRVRRTVFVCASLLVGAAVSVSGMINFVGLIVPHLLRLVVGPDQRVLLPASVLGGAVFLVWADAAARTALAPAELPVGVVTALLGGPFFLFLLRRSLRGER